MHARGLRVKLGGQVGGVLRVMMAMLVPQVRAGCRLDVGFPVRFTGMI